MKKKIAVLTSGGLDSTILTAHLLKQGWTVKPLYNQSGHRWEQMELFWLKRLLKALATKTLKPLTVLSVPTLDLYKNHWSMTGKKIPGSKSHDQEVYLPGKNLLLIAKASVFCALQKIPYLALAPLKTNPFADARRSFFKNLERACSEGLDFRFKILTPFLSRSKREVMKLGRMLPLHLTFSCLAPKRFRHCGKCNKCAERKRAFRKAGIQDKTSYA
ncbi:MAG: 7-cyano-7-deazaguanine synthase [Candidatus Omnitrophica bacterium]|nr:7-cyano-7-deazaguanine synthase [Candidatus Omnitrophota bacterium]